MSSVICKHLIHRILEGSVSLVLLGMLLENSVLIQGGDGLRIGFICGHDERDAVDPDALLKEYVDCGGQIQSEFGKKLDAGLLCFAVQAKVGCGLCHKESPHLLYKFYHNSA